MLKFKKGDIVNITNGAGKVVEAVYEGPEKIKNHHRVKIRMQYGKRTSKPLTLYLHESRFVIHSHGG